MTTGAYVRSGGELVIDSFEALGVEVFFGEPGQHALPMWEGLRQSSTTYIGSRTELNAAFAADGYARVTGKPAALVLSTGPGALISLAGLMESANSAVPIVAVVAQIPTEGLGAKRRGFVHELDDQMASFAPVVKRTFAARHAETLPDVIARAYQLAHSAPHGPVVVEVPVDILFDKVELDGPLVLDPSPQERQIIRDDSVSHAAKLLNEADSIVMIAGGGLVRTGAFDQFAELAHKLRANVVTTHTGRGSFPENDPLFVGPTGDDAAINELIGSADVVLSFGTKIGEETSGHFTLNIKGSLIQVDAEPLNIATNYRAVPLVADARDALEALLPRVDARLSDERPEKRAAMAKHRVRDDLERQGRGSELALINTIRETWPRDGVTSWDMTILGYWSTQYFPVETPRTYLYPHGSGSLGYALPAAIGAAAAKGPLPVLAVVGDGGFMYGISELAVMKQLNLPVRLLLVDNQKYGVLNEYQNEDFGQSYGVDLAQPDFVLLLESFGIPVRKSTPDTLADDLDWANSFDGPSAVVLEATPTMFQPTA